MLAKYIECWNVSLSLPRNSAPAQESVSGDPPGEGEVPAFPARPPAGVLPGPQEQPRHLPTPLHCTRPLPRRAGRGARQPGVVRGSAGWRGPRRTPAQRRSRPQPLPQLVSLGRRPRRLCRVAGVRNGRLPPFGRWCRREHAETHPLGASDELGAGRWLQGGSLARARQGGKGSGGNGAGERGSGGDAGGKEEVGWGVGPREQLDSRTGLIWCVWLSILSRVLLLHNAAVEQAYCCFHAKSVTLLNCMAPSDSPFRGFSNTKQEVIFWACLESAR